MKLPGDTQGHRSTLESKQECYDGPEAIKFEECMALFFLLVRASIHFLTLNLGAGRHKSSCS